MIKAVEALSANVKRIIDTASEPTTTYGVMRLLPDADEPITTGMIGKIHGAKTVRIPAINETIRSIMLLDIGNQRSQR